ncbi:MAG TPA: NAD-dependent epimerase/dehydratase family protein [Armatimonadota bacterium]|jgi:uncharacterized protein YbjT (DUF2867 family)
MRYVFAGATSGTGNAVVQRLVARVGEQAITCIVRETSNVDLLKHAGVRIHRGDIAVPSSYETLLADDVCFLDMTHPRYYPRTVPLLRASGVSRAYFVTTTGIYSRFHRCSDIYKIGENLIKGSGLSWTILRPSMIYGTVRDKNMHRLIAFLNRSPVFPLFGDGRSLMQPVYVEDLADGITAAMTNPNSEQKAYDLAGPHPIMYKDIIAVILGVLERRVTRVRVPMAPAIAAVRALQWLPGFPINDEQVLRLQEDKAFDISPAREDLGFSPRSFDKGIRLEIAEMCQGGAV